MARAKNMGKAGTGKSEPAPKRKSSRRKGIEGDQQEMPGTDQDRHPGLERYGRQWQDLKAERTALNERIAAEEAKINKAFEELAEDDPRKQAYRIKSGHVLRPTLVSKIKVSRPPSRDAKARADVDGDEVTEDSDD